MTEEEYQKWKSLSGVGDLISDEHPHGEPPGLTIFDSPEGKAALARLEKEENEEKKQREGSMNSEEIETLMALNGVNDILDENGNPLPPGPTILDSPEGKAPLARLDQEQGKNEKKH
jgi:hypothetical protein